MRNFKSPAHQAVLAALARGKSLTRSELTALRDKSELTIKLYKLGFWIGLGIFNVILWIDLPIPIPRNILLIIGFMALLAGFGFPIFGIRKHNRCLELLETAEPGPKKSRASDAGKDYIEQAKQDGRTFTRAEIEILEASRELDGEP